METQQTFEPSPPNDWSSPHNGKRVSEAEYWEEYYEHEASFEWNNGILEEIPRPHVESVEAYIWILLLLGEYLRANPIGRLMTLRMGFKIKAHERVLAIRKPDIGVFLFSNPIPMIPGSQFYQGAFDLCIEFLSFGELSEVERDTVVKKREYEQGKVSEYFILDSRGKETVFYTLNAKGRYERMPTEGGVVASKVLPGFQFRIEDVDTLPDQTLLMDDPVYSSYVLLDHQAERRAREADRQAREAAEQRILELEAQLKAMEQGN